MDGPHVARTYLRIIMYIVNYAKGFCICTLSAVLFTTTALTVQIPYTLGTHGTTITYTETCDSGVSGRTEE